MPAKKTRRPADAVHYMLSADRKFRRLSLKKISERVKTGRRRARGDKNVKSSSSPDAMGAPPSETKELPSSGVMELSSSGFQAPPSSNIRAARPSAPASRATRTPVPWGVAQIGFVVAGLVVLAILVGAWWPSSSSVDAQVADATDGAPVLSADVATPAAIAKTPVSPVDTQISGGQTRAATAVADTREPVVSAKATAPSPAVKASSVSPAPARVTPIPVDTAHERAEPAPAPAPRPAVPEDAQPLIAAASTDAVTISGCFDHDGKSAWLKDASGVDAPRSRSWRSGFLKKRSARIALVNGPPDVSAYDGRRVSVTGVLVDREMRVDSMGPIAGDCD